MKNVIAYVRVSTDAQAMDDKFGIESQKEIIADYCDKHDMSIMNWYVDRGESGVKENRPQLDSILYKLFLLPSLIVWREILNYIIIS